MMILAHMGWESYPIARLEETKDAQRIKEDMLTRAGTGAGPYFWGSPEAEKERPYPPHLLTIVDRPVDYSR